MPTLHYISREVLRKHGIDCLPWEVNNDVIPPPNTKTNIANSTDDETIRAEDLLNNNAKPDYLMNINNDRKPAAVVNLKTYSTSKPKYMDSYASVQPNCDVNNIIERVDFSIEEIFNSIDNKNIEINEIENDQKNSAANSIPQIDSLKTVIVKVQQRSDDTNANQDVRGRHHDCYPKHSTTTTTATAASASSTTASRDYSFVARVHELKTYKEKHGHLNLREYEDPSLYGFCNNTRQARRAIISGKANRRKLTDDQIAALDAIGFDWMLKASSTVKFFARVDELMAYKEKHGHLNVSCKEDQSLNIFCSSLRQSRRDMISGRGILPKLSEDKIAALDAIGFDWKLLGRRTREVESMIKQGDAVSIVVAPGRLWLTVTYVNNFMHGMDLSIRGGAKIIAINPACVFRDKVSVGDIIVTVDRKEVMRVEDVSIGTERSRELIIIRMTGSVISPVI